MGKPKKRTSSRRTGMRRSHLLRKLAESVNAKSPVKVLIGRKKKAAKAEKPVVAKKTAAKTAK